MFTLRRLFRQLRAKFGHYFWLPCPLCREYFAGYEWEFGHGLGLYVRGGETGTLVCRSCAPEARRLVEQEYQEYLKTQKEARRV